MSHLAEVTFDKIHTWQRSHSLVALVIRYLSTNQEAAVRRAPSVLPSTPNCKSMLANTICKAMLNNRTSSRDKQGTGLQGASYCKFMLTKAICEA